MVALRGPDTYQRLERCVSPLRLEAMTKAKFFTTEGELSVGFAQGRRVARGSSMDVDNRMGEWRGFMNVPPV